MSACDAEIVSWFATPIVSASIPGAQSLNRELVPLILEKEKAGDAYRHEMHIPTQVATEMLDGHPFQVGVHQRHQIIEGVFTTALDVPKQQCYGTFARHARMPLWPIRDLNRRNDTMSPL